MLTSLVDRALGAREVTPLGFLAGFDAHKFAQPVGAADRGGASVCVLRGR